MNIDTGKRDKIINNIPNHLISEKSPYLIQHAYNPVEWFPWGEKAFRKAKKENKPILLSVGYSTCHWCHVMEKESFTNSDIALIMNENFINVKVDREERPDVDRLYISAVTALTGSAGWPLNVFLTPELKPFLGGTYFPVKPMFGISTWPDILNKISAAWKDPVAHEKIISYSDALTDILRKDLSYDFYEEKKAYSKHAWRDHLAKAFEYYSMIYDGISGGFGKAPKFPSPSIFNFLFAYSMYEKKAGNRELSEKAHNMADFTLRKMAAGGIHDQVGGGFHRYSTDEKWHIPHFEKMLYDNAQLINSYLEAYRISSDGYFGKIARDTADYVLRDMTSPEGGFYSAEDADSIPYKISKKTVGNPLEKVEGAYYVWESDELKTILGDMTAEIFSFHFGFKPGGNAEYDPHGYFEGKNIVRAEKSVSETAEKFSISEEKTSEIINEAIEKLYYARTRRERPHLDDKILTSWNGLMISSLCKAFRILDDKKYLTAAKNAAEFIFSKLYDGKTGILYRRWRDGEKAVPGMGSDYAFYISGLIDLYESEGEKRWLEKAVLISDEYLRLFYDSKHDGFYMTNSGHDENLIIRIKEDSDGVIPSPSSVAIRNLLRLARITGRQDFASVAEKAVDSIISKETFHPASYPYLLAELCASGFYA